MTVCWLALIYAGRIIKFLMSPYKCCALVINTRRKKKQYYCKYAVLKRQFMGEALSYDKFGSCFPNKPREKKGRSGLNTSPAAKYCCFSVFNHTLQHISSSTSEARCWKFCVIYDQIWVNAQKQIHKTINTYNSLLNILIIVNCMSVHAMNVGKHLSAYKTLYHD